MTHPTQRDLIKVLNEFATRLRNLETRPGNRFIPEFSNSECLDLFGEGSVVDPFSYGLRISGESGNQIECRENGLFVGGGQSVGFDALVDGTAIVDDPDARLFTTISAACEYLTNTVGLDAACIAVRPNATVGYYTETADWDSPSSVTLIGMRGLDSADSARNVGWRLGNFQPISAGAVNPPDYRIVNFTNEVKFGSPGSTYFRNLWLHNCRVDDDVVTTTLPGSALATSLFAENCTLVITGNGSWTVATTGTYIGCNVELQPVSSGTQTVSLGSSRLSIVGSRLANSGTGTANLTLPVDFSVDVSDNTDAGGSVSQVNMNVPSGASGTLRLNASQGPNHSGYNVSATSTFVFLAVYGAVRTLTITGAHDSLLIHAANMIGDWDIRGPAILHSTTREGAGASFILRGEGVTGTISVANWNNSGDTLVSFIDADYCNIQVGADGSAASGGSKPYSLDASSTKNLLTFAGATTFPAVGTDVGADNQITVT